MRVGIVGCGAVGSLFAAHLAQLYDVETWIYDVDQVHTEAIMTRGLRLIGVGEIHSWPKATTNPDDLPYFDFGIIATKGVHTETAIRATAHAFTKGAVCSVQNGIGNEEVIAQHVEQVIRGATSVAGHLIEAGVCHWDSMGATWIGPYESASFASVESLAELLNRSGLETKALKDCRAVQWSKLTFNAATNPIAALTRLPHGYAASRPNVHWLMNKVIAEGKAVAAALGIRMEVDPEELLQESIEIAFNHKPSMLQDVEDRRRTEIDQLNGGIVRLGEQLGVPTPFNRAVTAMIKGLEASWDL